MIPNPSKTDQASAAVDRPKILSIASKVHVLRKMQTMTGTITTRSQGQLLRPLNAEEMALAAELLIALEEKDRKQASDDNRGNK